MALGYTKLGDEVARNQYVNGSAGAVLTTQPVPARATAVHVPLTLTAPVIAYNIDYEPVCTDEEVVLTRIRTEAAAIACGYPSLEELRADIARAGQPIRDLRLDARLVAKLLTQSYQNSMINCGPDCAPAVNRGVMPAWTLDQPTTLTDDAEFRALNPQLHLRRTTSLSEPVLEALRSDGAAQVWRWLLSDESAASFLAGCPDDQGVTVNPFYSSRTYVGCPGQAAELDDAAEAKRQATDSPAGFADLPLTYPPDGSPFPLPNWQEQPAEGGRPARTLVDHLPRVDVMQVAARDALIGYKPRNSDFCEFTVDPTCFPAPGKWKDPKTLQRFGERELLALTDAPSAARFKLPTALLCDDAGEACVGASTTSLRKAADRFVASPVAGARAPAARADLPGGAYPLTMPVYAAIRPTLPQSARAAYADALEYVVTKGQVPGYLPGDLPPGYAPLTETLVSDAKVAVAQLRKAVPAKATTTTKPPTASATPEPTEEPAASPSASPGAARAGGDAARPVGAGGRRGARARRGRPGRDGARRGHGGHPPGCREHRGLAGLAAAGRPGAHVWAGLAGPFMRRRSSVRFR